MKRTTLRISAWLSLIGGIYVAIRTFQIAANVPIGRTDLVIWGIAYFISGVAAYALFATIADIANQLEEGFIIKQ